MAAEVIPLDVIRAGLEARARVKELAQAEARARQMLKLALLIRDQILARDEDGVS